MRSVAMKPLLTAFAIAGLLLGLAGSSYAHQGPRVYPILELSDEDLAQIDIMDGSIDDWLAVVGEPTMTALDFYALGSYHPADLDFRIWLAWHDHTDRIYVAMERADDVHVNEYDRTLDVGVYSAMAF